MSVLVLTLVGWYEGPKRMTGIIIMGEEAGPASVRARRAVVRRSKTSSWATLKLDRDGRKEVKEEYMVQNIHRFSRLDFLVLCHVLKQSQLYETDEADSCGGD